MNNVSSDIKIDTAIMLLLRNSPFYAHVIMQMGRVEVSERVIDNMAVRFRTGIPVLIWCRKFIDQLDVRSLVFYLTHEIEHLVRLHPILMMRLSGKYPLEDRLATYLSIKAMHFAMNPDVEREMKCIGIPTPSYYTSEFPSAKGLDNGHSSEWYFDYLVKDSRKQDTQDLKDLAKQLADHMWSNAIVEEAGDDPENQYFGIDWKGKPLTEADISNIVGQVQNIANKAAEKSRGIIPSHIQELINSMNAPAEIPWQDQLRKFVMSKAGETKRLTYVRVSKRWGDMVRGKVRSRRRAVLVVTDSSGSVSDEQLSMFFNECRHMSSEYTTIWVMECDEAIQSIIEVDRYKRTDFVAIGRGGTSFESPFKYAYGIADDSDFASVDAKIACEKVLKKVGKFDGVVYLTDGYAPSPNLPQRIPTMWVTTDADPFEWGQVIHFPRV